MAPSQVFKSMLSDQNHSTQTLSRSSAFPAIIRRRSLSPRPSTAVPSAFGGPCVHRQGSSKSWSLCYVVQDDGQLQPQRDVSELDVIKKPEESLEQEMDRLKLYSLSACRLIVTSSGTVTKLSGVWIKGRTRDIILTASPFGKDLIVSPENTTAEVFPTYAGDNFNCPSVKCGLIHDFNNAMEKKSFAIFAPLSGEDTRSPAQSVEIQAILPEAGPLFGTAVSFGYNGEATKKNPDHDALAISDCRCITCWRASALSVCPDLDSPDPRALHPDYRTISVGEWKHSQTSGEEVCHTVTGWYGTSGAGMYAEDGDKNFRLVALFQNGIQSGLDLDKNGAVVITREVVQCLDEAGRA
ncbi:MAG: hypothetical protein M1820_008988 [Bogoriella megaspora]|nr:MAG: hypothetical protein M1820_008988 [Bogoriella megaspora]